MLREVTPDILARALADPVLLGLYDQAVIKFDQYRTAKSWWQRHVDRRPQQGDRVLLRGVRASPVAADLRRRPRRAGRRPLQGGERPRRAARRRRVHVSAGLLPPADLGRRGGSRRSTSGSTGRDAPVAHARTLDDKPCLVLVPLGTRTVLVRVWEVRLGRVRLLLLDTDLEQNAPWDRELSARLYGGGQDTRLQQEVVLGLGRRARAARAGPAASRLAPQRRSRGLRRPPAPARLRRRGESWDDALHGSPAHDDLHDAHAGARRP